MWGHTHPDTAFDEHYKGNSLTLNTSAANRESITATPSGIIANDGAQDFGQKLLTSRGYQRVTAAMVLTGKSFSLYPAAGYPLKTIKHIK